ncbi:MAG: DICT sensory domain-containing protein [Spirulina sp.]
MSSPTSFSLYALIQQESLAPISASLATLEAIARAWIDILRSEQIKGTLWVHPGTVGDWWEEIARYSEGGTIYYCDCDAGEVRDGISLILPIHPQEAFVVVQSERI